MARRNPHRNSIRSCRHIRESKASSAVRNNIPQTVTAGPPQYYRRASDSRAAYRRPHGTRDRTRERRGRRARLVTAAASNGDGRRNCRCEKRREPPARNHDWTDQR